MTPSRAYRQPSRVSSSSVVAIRGSYAQGNGRPPLLDAPVAPPESIPTFAHASEHPAIGDRPVLDYFHEHPLSTCRDARPASLGLPGTRAGPGAGLRLLRQRRLPDRNGSARLRVHRRAWTTFQPAAGPSGCCAGPEAPTAPGRWPVAFRRRGPGGSLPGCARAGRDGLRHRPARAEERSGCEAGSYPTTWSRRTLAGCMDGTATSSARAAARRAVLAARQIVESTPLRDPALRHRPERQPDLLPDALAASP
jgi:hypothetical protein